MNALFAALQARHPSYEVIDIRFSADPTVQCELDMATVDEQLAHAVMHARELDIASLMITLGLS